MFAVAWFAYLALAAPMSGLRQLANLATADRFSYVATIPFYVLAAAGILRWGRGAAAAALLAAGGLCALTLPQIGVWHDPVTLWTRVLEQWPDRGPEPHDHLGAWYAHEGKESAAIQEFRASLRIAEQNPTAHNNLGRMLEGRGDTVGAEKEYRRSAALAPGFAVARWNLARLLARRGRKAEAEKWYREALATGGWVHPGLKAEVEGLLGIPR
jgi:tetratricopeptide (TPR) repeat protein